jgi:hypothetical protein
MTEAEWLAGADQTPMLQFLEWKASDRKSRLFATAVARKSPYSSEIEWWVEIAEQFADGRAELREVSFARERRAAMFTPAILAAWVLSHEMVASCIQISPLLQRDAQAAGFLRDIFGNPFRPVTFDTSWRTDTALTLARQMYESRDFGAMPILADALQDAGCEDEQVLSHCRDPGPHVRGCWVVDLLLGKG